MHPILTHKCFIKNSIENWGNFCAHEISAKISIFVTFGQWTHLATKCSESEPIAIMKKQLRHHEVRWAPKLNNLIWYLVAWSRPKTLTALHDLLTKHSTHFTLNSIGLPPRISGHNSHARSNSSENSPPWHNLISVWILLSRVWQIQNLFVWHPRNCKGS
jgi:hypothetical protein